MGAEELDTAPKDLWGKLKTGATIAALTDAQGAGQQALIDAFIVQLTEWLGGAVAEDGLSQEDADGWLARKEGAGLDLLSKTWAARDGELDRDGRQSNRGRENGCDAAGCTCGYGRGTRLARFRIPVRGPATSQSINWAGLPLRPLTQTADFSKASRQAL